MCQLTFSLSQVVLHRPVEDNYDGGPAVVPADCPLIQLDGDMDMNTSNQCAMTVPLPATLPNDTPLLTTEINLPKQESGKIKALSIQMKELKWQSVNQVFFSDQHILLRSDQQPF